MSVLLMANLFWSFAQNKLQHHFLNPCFDGLPFWTIVGEGGTAGIVSASFRLWICYYNRVVQPACVKAHVFKQHTVSLRLHKIRRISYVASAELVTEFVTHF